MKVAACALLSVILVTSSGAAQSQGPRRPRDPVLTEIIRREPDFSDPRTRHMEILADIWGNLALYHPAPSTWRLKWDDVLVQALRELPGVRSEHDFAALLNRVVFAPLKDPLLYATTIAENDTIPVLPKTLTYRVLRDGSAYISATDQAYSRTTFPKALSALIDSVSENKAIRRLIVDLRSSNPGFYREVTGGASLGLWLRQTSSRGQDVSLFRTTDCCDINGYRVMLTPRDSLKSIAPYQAMPTVFLVNRTSYGAIEQSLDAVRNARKDIAVVFEAEGSIPDLGWNSFQKLYPDSILLSHPRTAAIAVDGALGTVVDVQVARINTDSLESLADRAMAARAIPALRSPFVVSDSRIRDDTVSMRSLTSEERMAGLLKVWFWAGHFDAYLDDGDYDWRHVVSLFASKIQNAKSDTDYYRTLVEIGQSLHDTHVVVRHPIITAAFRLGDFTIPASVRWLGDRAIIMTADSSVRAAGVNVGDEIIAIDDAPIARLRTRKGRYFSQSLPGNLAPFREFLFGPQNSTMRLRVRTPGGIREIALQRTLPTRASLSQNIAAHSTYAVLPRNIGYIELAKISSSAMSDSAFEALRDTRGIILDDRSPLARDSELETFRFLSAPLEWIRRVESIGYMHSNFMPTVALGSERTWTVPFRFGKWKYTKPLVVMISDQLVSAAESDAQWLTLSHRAVFVGSQTNGTYGTADAITLPGGARFQFTVGRALFPTGEKYHRIGIQPDVQVTPTVAGIRAGRDEVLETAVATLAKLTHGELNRKRR